MNFVIQDFSFLYIEPFKIDVSSRIQLSLEIWSLLFVITIVLPLSAVCMAKSLYPIVLFNVFISSSGRSLWKILETCLKDEYSWHNLYEKLEKLNYYRQKPSFNEIKASQSSWFQGSNYVQFKTSRRTDIEKNPNIYNYSCRSKWCNSWNI